MFWKEEGIVQIRLWNNNLKVRLIGEALFNMLFWMYFPFITVYFGAALGNRIAGILMTVPPIFSLIGSLLGGVLADRSGRRPVMLLGASIQTVMFAFFAVSPSSWIDYIAFIGIGLGGALYSPASSAMVADLVPANNRRQIFATFTTANNIGAVLGPALGAIFFFHYRQVLLWTCALVLLLYVRITRRMNQAGNKDIHEGVSCSDFDFLRFLCPRHYRGSLLPQLSCRRSRA
jgi:MFS family permease